MCSGGSGVVLCVCGGGVMCVFLFLLCFLLLFKDHTNPDS